MIRISISILSPSIIGRIAAPTSFPLLYTGSPPLITPIGQCKVSLTFVSTIINYLKGLYSSWITALVEFSFFIISKNILKYFFVNQNGITEIKCQNDNFHLKDLFISLFWYWFQIFPEQRFFFRNSQNHFRKLEFAHEKIWTAYFLK